MPKIITDLAEAGEVFHEWQAPEYEKHTRVGRWYWIMGTLGVLLVGYALFSQNFLFALIIVLFAIILYLQSKEDPVLIPFKITDTGVVIHNRLYTFDEFENFYIVYNPPEVKVLFLETKSTFRPRLRLPLIDQNPNEIRFTLRQYVVEDTDAKEEPASDKVARLWQIH